MAGSSRCPASRSCELGAARDRLAGVEREPATRRKTRPRNCGEATRPRQVMRLSEGQDDGPAEIIRWSVVGFAAQSGPAPLRLLRIGAAALGRNPPCRGRDPPRKQAGGRQVPRDARRHGVVSMGDCYGKEARPAARKTANVAALINVLAIAMFHSRWRARPTPLGRCRKRRPAGATGRWTLGPAQSGDRAVEGRRATEIPGRSDRAPAGARRSIRELRDPGQGNRVCRKFVPVESARPAAGGRLRGRGGGHG